jgi:2-oxoglutarate ferredoxin oxidoreductase subunit alpha
MAWGGCKGAVLEAVQQLRAQGVKVRAVVPRLLWPFPLQHVEPALEGLKTIHVVELSYSAQFHTFLRSQLRADLAGRLVRHARAGGAPMGANEVVAWVQGAGARAAAD